MTENKKHGFLGEQSIVLPASVRSQLQANPLTRDLYVTDVGFYPHARFHHRQRKQGSDEHILIYVTNGSGEVSVGEDRHLLLKNDGIIIPKDTPHQYGTNDTDAWTIYWVHFDGPKAQFLTNRFGTKFSLRTHHSEREDVRISLFKELIHTLSRGYTQSNLEYVSLSFQQLLASVLYPDQFMHHLNAKDSDTISKSISFMKNHVGESLSLAKLANHAGLSVAHYSKLFTQKTGFSPVDHFIQLKMQHACQLLDVTPLYVKEIAQQLGYQDPYYFSRIFKKIMQVSPVAYRKRDKTKGNESY